MDTIAQQRTWVRRTRYVINRRFQLRYIGLFLLSALFASLTVGGILYAIVEMNWLLQLDRGLHFLPETKELLSYQRLIVCVVFSVTFLFMALLLSLWGLFLSHRVAGPVFSISRRLQKIVLEYDFKTPLMLRKKDALQEVKDLLNETLSSIFHRYEAETLFWGEMGDRIASIEQKFVSLRTFGGSQFKFILRQVDLLKKDKIRCLGNSS